MLELERRKEVAERSEEHRDISICIERGLVAVPARVFLGGRE
jgi:hypothetical protein